MLSLYLKKISGKTNYLTSIYYGHKFPFYYACEFPRSGGTWIAHMISDYLQLSFPKNSIFPIGHSCVIHNHWQYNPKLIKPIYIVRDGRDVAVSTMYYTLKNSKKSRYYVKRFPSLFNNKVNGMKDKQLFKIFISDWFIKSAGTKLSWANHVRQWVFNKNVICVKYEDFHRNCSETLKFVLNRLGIVDIDMELLNMTVKKFSFVKQTGRKPGDANKKDNKRKGIIGDWKEHFNKETAFLFHQHTGNLLLKLNYETDPNWYKSL